MSDLCYVCEEKAELICRKCESKVCQEHSKFHGLKCIISTKTRYSRSQAF